MAERSDWRSAGRRQWIHENHCWRGQALPVATDVFPQSTRPLDRFPGLPQSGFFTLCHRHSSQHLFLRHDADEGMIHFFFFYRLHVLHFSIHPSFVHFVCVCVYLKKKDLTVLPV